MYSMHQTHVNMPPYVQSGLNDVIFVQFVESQQKKWSYTSEVNYGFMVNAYMQGLISEIMMRERFEDKNNQLTTDVQGHFYYKPWRTI